METDLPHKENKVKCIWVSIVGKLDAQLVRFGLKKGRKQLTCHEFANLIQDIIDTETTAEELALFEQQQKKCACCNKRFQLEKETIAVVREHLARQATPQDLEAMIRSKILYSQ
ncbi:MAG: hypothetical protein ACPGJS_11270 [Flammeovirgaceae bacterium]